MKTRALAALAALALLAAGCPSGGSIPLDKYSDEAYRAVCARYVHCGMMRSEAACNAFLDTFLSSYYDLDAIYGDWVSSGKMKYDGARARRCFDSYASVSCASNPYDFEDCRTIFEGQVGVGGECVLSQECVPSAYCTYSAGPSSSTCPGTCKARVAEGGAATSSTECVVPLILVDGKCSRPRQAGESCSLFECASGLSCVEQACKAPAAEGEACSSSTQCSQNSFLTCVGGTCRALGDVGQDCASGSLFPCKLDLTCDASTSKCQERIAEGQPCVDLSSSCALGLTCSTDSKKCVPMAVTGQSCGAVTCDKTTYCETATTTCKPRLARGQPCTQTGSCSSIDNCSNGTCKSLFSCP